MPFFLLIVRQTLFKGWKDAVKADHVSGQSSTLKQIFLNVVSQIGKVCVDTDYVFSSQLVALCEVH